MEGVDWQRVTIEYLARYKLAIIVLCLMPYLSLRIVA